MLTDDQRIDIKLWAQAENNVYFYYQGKKDAYPTQRHVQLKPNLEKRIDSELAVYGLDLEDLCKLKTYYFEAMTNPVLDTDSNPPRRPNLRIKKRQ